MGAIIGEMMRFSSVCLAFYFHVEQKIQISMIFISKHCHHKNDSRWCHIQCQEMKNFTLVAHWGNSYSYSFLRVTPFDFLTTFEIFKGKSQNDQLSRQKVLIFQHCMGLAIDFFALSVMRVGCLTIFVIFCIGRSSKYTSITHARWNR